MIKDQLIKWLRAIAITTAILIGPSSCFFYGKCNEVLPYFRIEGLILSNKVLTGNAQNPMVDVPNNEQASWADHLIRVDFQTTYYAGGSHNKAGNSLYALSCSSDGERGSQVGIDTLYVVTMFDYNQNYEANDTINAMVSITDDYYQPADFRYFRSLEEYVSINKEIIRSFFLNIRINQQPLSSGVSQFKIIYLLRDGRRLEALTPGIQLTNG